jgi:hypothetical protein
VGGLLGDLEAIDDAPLRLAAAVLLGGGAIYFFGRPALESLGAALATAVVLLGAMYVGFHNVGIRGIRRVWPGAVRALSTALILACLCPPGLPPALVAGLVAIAIVIDGVQKGLLVPLALSGVLIVWPLTWLWRVRSGMEYLAPFTLRPLDEPIALWTKFQIAVDPVRMYTGNVAGAMGATSFGLAALGLLVLAYGRRVSWPFVLAFYGVVAVVMTVAHQPLTVYLLGGQALVFAGILAAESRKLPLLAAWRMGAGLLAGAIAAFLLLRGVGVEAFGAGVVITAALVSVFQLFGLAGSPSVVPQAAPTATSAIATDEPIAPLRPGRLALLVLVAPVGLYLLARDDSVPREQRLTLVGLGAVLYAAAIAGSLAWLWVLRLPA